jgi:thiamine pyrophosphokinase
MLEGVLFIGGKNPKKTMIETIVERSDCIVAADSGYDYVLNNGITPDYVVGDMDSIKDPTVLRDLPEKKIKRYNKEKDETDTEIGINVLWENGIYKITVIGGGGGRLDHTFGLFTLFERYRSPFQWFTHKARVIRIDGRLSLNVEKGELLSFFPIGDEMCKMYSDGLKWPLDELSWSRGDMGLSNVAMKNEITVTMKQGRLILIKEIGRERIIE